MKRILIFKNDMLGDFLQLSGCIKEIHENFKDSEITLVCSKNNYQIAKNFSFISKFIILSHRSFIKTITQNFKAIFFKKYYHVFVFDGKNSSFLTSCFVRAEKRSTLCFWKKKNFLFFKYNLYRPNKFFLYLFFKNYIICDEDYSNTEIRYQELYFKLLENLHIRVSSKKNHYILNNQYKNQYTNFYNKYINNNYVLFHFDEKWNNYSVNDFNNALKIIYNLSSKTNVVLTTGIKPFIFLNKLENLFPSFDYVQNNIIKINDITTSNISLLKNIPLDLLAYFIANSSKNITSHSGPIINISPVFNVKIVDLIKKKKFNELGRWIPLISNYKRFSLEEIDKSINDI